LNALREMTTAEASLAVHSGKPGAGDIGGHDLPGFRPVFRSRHRGSERVDERQ
jgi:hypothetical protein